MQVRDFSDGVQVAQAMLVRDLEVRVQSAGRECLELLLGDRSGSVLAQLDDDVQRARQICCVGAVVHVRGRFRAGPRHGGRLLLESVRAAGEGEYDPADLAGGPHRTTGQMEADLRALVETVQNPHLRRLLSALLGEESSTWARYRDAPAAKHYHQAYRHGLLEHCLTVAQAVGAISATFPGIDRDLAVTGALLHDIGKLEAYELSEGAIGMSDQGRLHGEIALGYYRVRRQIERMRGFPPDLERALLHIILSHHGSLEHGSPVVPCTREATLVHMIDNLGGKLGSFDRVQRDLPAGAQWSGYDKGIGAGAYFGARTLEGERAAA
jgi:3'-5' exoribonuclease